MIWIVGFASFIVGAIVGLVLAACLFAAGRYDDWNRK